MASEAKEKCCTFDAFKIFLALFLAIFILFTFIIERDGDCASELLKAKRFEYEKFHFMASENCFLKNYNTSDCEECFTKLSKNRDTEKSFKKIIFIGSHETKNFYSAFRDLVWGNEGNVSQNNETEQFSTNGIQAQFIYHPFPDSSFRELLKTWQKNALLPDVVITGFRPFQDINKSIDDVLLDSFIGNVSELTFEIDLLSEESAVFWSVPFFGLAERNDELFQLYKYQIRDVLKPTHVKLWDISAIGNSISDDNVFKTDFSFETQILLNYFCNKLQTDTSLCCISDGNALSHDQKIVIALMMIIILTGIAFAYIYCNWKALCSAFQEICGVSCPFLPWRSSSVEISKLDKVDLSLTENSLTIKEKPSPNYFLLVIKCCLIFAYFFICDRTSLFEKDTKDFNNLSFFLPLLIAVIVAFTIRGKCSSSSILNREITDEWKGWMQVVILIYHMTGASSQITIYMHIRILVSSYLFMTGYGNVSYYLRGGELTFRRYCQVMLRMNLLTIVLCIVMGRYYQFYYFVPLVSFWYTLLFLALLLPPNLSSKTPEGKPCPTNTDYANTCVKIGCLFSLVAILSLSKRVFDFIFLLPIWRFLFILPGHDDYEWWFRWQLDKYSIFSGALFGIIFQYNSQRKISEVKSERSVAKTILLILVGVSAMSFYFLLTSVCFSKQDCNTLHAMVFFIPILGYVLIRNLTETIRSYYSVVMYKAGKISLELFICQYHIWLAGDTKGILVLLPWAHPIINFVVVSVIFVCVAHEVHFITGEFVNLLVPKDNRKICMNLVALGFSVVALRHVL